ncbi:hypothetical protein AX17_004744 [Amanita inopinata Kibby_2008]|nr:hypothetical protein AX17_004744 [Amanita inopinata Kibby_2008]
MSTAMQKQFKEVVVLGAGVVGLTTAILIQERGGYHVTVIADVLPTDPKTIRYTSHWAGAHHVSNDTTNQLQRELEERTLHKLWELSEPGTPTEKLFLRLPQTDYYRDPRREDDPLKNVHDFKHIPSDALRFKAVEGVTFTVLTIDTPRYLNYLLSRFLSAGGSTVRASVQHIDQIIQGGADVFSPARRASSPFGTSRELPPSPDAVVVCAGIGARALGGVEDTNVYPIRGQTVLLRAPWVNLGRTIGGGLGAESYIIPRRSGEVIVGGTREENDWYPIPRPETSRRILEDGLALCPELAPPEIRAVREPTIDDILPFVIEEGCGLRPARKGGIRLEVEHFARHKGDGKVPVVHNYGHAGYGFQTSWASAEKALGLLEGTLAAYNN